MEGGFKLELYGIIVMSLLAALFWGNYHLYLSAFNIKDTLK